MTTHVEFKHFHLFAGLGGGAAGFNRGHARIGSMTASWRCIGGIDVDPDAIRDFKTLTGVEGTVMDLFDREQYTAFHGHEPPPDWREATPEDIRRAAGFETPHAVLLSAPCKGFSGLLSETKSKTEKYQALNRLTLRGVWLMLEAWQDDPPELVCFENVPRLQTRGRALLDRITSLLRSYGYATAETTHDCGNLGGLAQSRNRFLLVARHTEKVAPMLYQPESRPLRGVGEVLGRMLMPGDPKAGPMHQVPRLMWKTWVRLAFVKAGSDWRSLNDLRVEDGQLKDYLLVPEMHRGTLGVRAWTDHAGTITGNARPGTGAFSVADVRFDASSKWKDGQAYGVRRWSEPTGTVAGQQTPGQGSYSVADPRRSESELLRLRIVPASLGGADVQQAMAAPDVRSGLEADRSAYLTAGHYGVVKWQDHCGAVSAAAGHDNGKWSVSDPRMPEPSDNLVAVIRALDGTWHRPFTTLELAALQSLVDPEQHLVDEDRDCWAAKKGASVIKTLAGSSDTAFRERIGNAIPPAAAQAIADEMARTLLLAHTGETFQLSSVPIWVKNLGVALSVSHQ